MRIGSRLEGRRALERMATLSRLYLPDLRRRDAVQPPATRRRPIMKRCAPRRADDPAHIRAKRGGLTAALHRLPFLVSSRPAGARCRRPRARVRCRRHLVAPRATVLPGYVGNTLALVLLVGAGVGIGGTAAGWLDRAPAFSGQRHLRVGAAAAPGDAGLRDGLRVHRFPPVRRAAADRAARACSAGRATTTGSRTIRSLPGAAAMFVFALYPYVYLLARTAFIERSAGADRGRRARWASTGAPRSGASNCRSRGPPSPAGIALALMETLADLRHGRLFRGRYVHHRHLSRVVLARRPRRRGAARLRAAAVRAWCIALERASRGAARTYGGARGRAARRLHASR